MLVIMVSIGIPIMVLLLNGGSFRKIELERSGRNSIGRGPVERSEGKDACIRASPAHALDVVDGHVVYMVLEIVLVMVVGTVVGGCLTLHVLVVSGVILGAAGAGGGSDVLFLFPHTLGLREG